ncbi:PREDICTED: vegetative cell wall protein gp1 [Tarenaya hassleriana]|uniref:vegetative cell wall protein gp1 n=1 Tax=Tarenaya hassleriana TaxID=28532 RepID=UPI00053C69ED|nr:PREDICTED: vegetative cell wall protein gp1 [Tarenaya hassleriana]
MARTNNKYTSINFNHILHTDHLPSSSTGSYSSVARPHGRMLVVSRPSPKPLTSPTPTTPPTTDQAPSDQISLRPLGRTGPGPSPSLLTSPLRNPEVASPVHPVESPKPDRFVPPHLRPGFVGREAKPGPDAPRVKDLSQRSPPQHHHHQQQQQRQDYFGLPGRYEQNGRPRSGGYERIDADPDHLGRPRSSGSRPGST